MALVSVSKAIELSGVSRATFYRNFLNKGLISTSRDEQGKKGIDTSELLRVFPGIRLDSDTVSPIQNEQSGQTEQNTTGKDDLGHTTELDSLRQQLEEAKQRELKLEKREAWYQQQIAEEKARAIEEKLRAERAEIKLLEHLEPPESEPTTPPDEQLIEEVAELKESLRQLSTRKWWEVWK